MPSPSVTVITPTYCRASFLQQTLRSVEAQSLVDFEYLIASDGGTEDVKAVARGAQASDPRVRFLDLPHRGVFRTLDATFREARGQYVAVVADDDLWHPDFLHRLVGVFEGDSKAYAFVSCDYSFLHDGEVGGPRCPYASEAKASRSGVVTAFINSLFSKHYLDLVAASLGYYFDPHLRRLGDEDLFLSLLRIGAPTKHIHAALSYYRQHADQFAAKPFIWSFLDRATVAARAGKPMRPSETIREIAWLVNLRMGGRLARSRSAPRER